MHARLAAHQFLPAALILVSGSLSQLRAYIALLTQLFRRRGHQPFRVCASWGVSWVGEPTEAQHWRERLPALVAALSEQGWDGLLRARNLF